MTFAIHPTLAGGLLSTSSYPGPGSFHIFNIEQGILAIGKLRFRSKLIIEPVLYQIYFVKDNQIRLIVDQLIDWNGPLIKLNRNCRMAQRTRGSDPDTSRWKVSV